MKKALVPLAALAFALSASIARAQTPFPPQEAPAIAGPYVGASIAASQARRGCTGFIVGGGRTCDDRDYSWALLAGYKLNRFFAAEAEYRDIGIIQASSPTSSLEMHVTAWDVAGLAFVPLSERFSAYFKFGGYRALLQSPEGVVADHNANGFTYGGGVQLDFASRLGLRAQFQRYRQVDGGVDFGTNDYDTLGVVLLLRLR
jgi:opacity protein-like surface antigen